MLKKVWKVYKKDSYECVAFNTEELAKAQTLFEESDLTIATITKFTENQIIKLEKGEAVWL